VVAEAELRGPIQGLAPLVDQAEEVAVTLVPLVPAHQGKGIMALAHRNRETAAVGAPVAQAG